MNSPQPTEDWTKGKKYAVITLVVAVFAAIAQALVVPPAWIQANSSSSTPTSANSNPSVTAPPVTTPPVMELPVTPIPKQQNICGVWLSLTSRKQYNFVCQDQDAFVIYEVSDQQLIQNGSGTLTNNGDVKARLFLSNKKRTAHISLRLSPDGQKMEGSWRGDDPRESGALMFHKVK
jgi:hypothetical protein